MKINYIKRIRKDISIKESNSLYLFAQVEGLEEQLNELITPAEKKATDKLLLDLTSTLGHFEGLLSDIFLLELYVRYSPEMENLEVGRRKEWHAHREQVSY